MGGSSSKASTERRVDPPYGLSGGSSPYHFRDSYGYQEASPYYSQGYNSYTTPGHSDPPPPLSSSSSSSYDYEHEWHPQTTKRSDSKYTRIADNYHTLDEVTAALAQAGLESSNLIVGIDFTKSNEWTGAKSFKRRCLHDIGGDSNPYEQAISIIGRTLSAFDEDNLIPCFGFGDASTHDNEVFSFYPDERPCAGFEEVLKRYREIVPRLRLAGPTSYGPIIEMGISIVEQKGGQYHVLLIIADGQVTRNSETIKGQFSPQEQKTIDAIVRASNYPLSIVVVGVGDGPWDTMKEFDDNIPARAFDNFQFVNFTEIMSKNVNQAKKEAEFSLAALMEIPSQYKATIYHNLLGRKNGYFERFPLPTPISREGASRGASSHSPQPSFPKGATSGSGSSSRTAHGSQMGTAPPSNLNDHQLCPICLSNAKDMAFGCGHQTCCKCGEDLPTCPICRCDVHTRIKLY